MGIQESRESRRLTAHRAGLASERFAAQRLDRFVRSHLPPIGLSVVVVLALGAIEWLVLTGRPQLQGLATGFVVGAGLTFLYHWCVISSGAASSTMGQAAEQWTDAELRRLRRKGWKHVNHLVIRNRQGDVDHVAIGPDGVLVIETKWRSTDIDVDELSSWEEKAITQTRRNRDDVRRLLGWRERDERPIEGVLVLWGPEVTHESAQAVLAGDVNVVAGQHLRDELDFLSDARLTQHEIDDAYAKVVAQLEKADGWEASDAGEVAPTVQARAAAWARQAYAAMCGLFLSLLTLKLDGWWPALAIGALAAGGLSARRAGSIKRVATWFVCGVVAVVPLGVVVAVASL